MLWRKKLGSLFIVENKTNFDTPAVNAGRIAFDKLETKKDYNLDNLHMNYVMKSEAEIHFGR